MSSTSLQSAGRHDRGDVATTSTTATTRAPTATHASSTTVEPDEVDYFRAHLGVDSNRRPSRRRAAMVQMHLRPLCGIHGSTTHRGHGRPPCPGVASERPSSPLPFVLLGVST